MARRYAVLSKRLGLKRVYVIDDGSGEWRTVLSDPFRQVARKLGVRIAGSATFDPEARSSPRSRIGSSAPERRAY